MTIDLPADLERFIHDEVQAGRYPSEQEVVLAALEQLRDRTPRRARGWGRSVPCATTPSFSIRLSNTP